MNCLWNDVIFLIAVHPSEIKTELKKVGFKCGKDWNYFEIDASKIDSKNAYIYVNDKGPITEEISPLSPEQIIPFDANRLSEYAVIPEKTKQYYRQASGEGKRRNEILDWLYIPHILYKGTIDISKCKIIIV